MLGMRRADAGGEGARLGITASRRVGGAVERNRVKRLVREWFRNAKAMLPGDLEIVVIAKSATAELDQAQASRELSRLVEDVAR
jgi:ribonuclease P protein component